MSSSKSEADPDESIICLDSSIDISIDTDNDTNLSISEVVNLEQTLPPGVAPDGFILIDEDTEPSNVLDIINDSTKDEEKEKPIFKVFFRDENASKVYKKRVREFLHRLVPSETRDEDSDLKNLVLEVWEKKTGRKRSHEHVESTKRENKKDLDNEDVNLLFKIEKRPTLQDRLDVPTYGKKFEQIMDFTSESAKLETEKEKNKLSCRPKMTCWNCLGNHAIRDCTEPRNQMEISKNRYEFVARSSAPKGGRYHVENEKFGHFVPGQISKNLKRALGVRDNELPNHIYRMRILGYPPGWLKEARLQHSGMNLYDSDGSRELDPMEEPGQIVETGDKDRYDIRKIQEYPGFNVPAPPGTKENDKKYWKSNQYSTNSKDSLLAMINMKGVEAGYKRKKMKRNVDRGSVNAEVIPSEAMDVVELADDIMVENVSANGLFIPPLPKSPPKPPLPPDLEDGPVDSPKAASLDLEFVASPTYVDSPTLADLERRKKQLLEELDDSSAPSPPNTPITSRSCSLTSNASCLEQQESANPINEETPQTVKPLTALTTPSRGTVKTVALGTPILESTSPYNKLPSVENFSKDICDIIHFENLPDSTGKYEKMTGILQKVRNTLATIQQE